MARAELLEQGWDLGCLGLPNNAARLPRIGRLDGDRYGRKRVLSPGFVAFCAVAVVIEVLALTHFYGAVG
jgi:hypothetical protein